MSTCVTPTVPSPHTVPATTLWRGADTTAPTTLLPCRRLAATLLRGRHHAHDRAFVPPFGPRRRAAFLLRPRACSGRLSFTATNSTDCSLPRGLQPLRCDRLQAGCACGCGLGEPQSQRYHPARSELAPRCAPWLVVPSRSVRLPLRRHHASAWRRRPRRFRRALLLRCLTARDVRSPLRTQGLWEVVGYLPLRRSCPTLMTWRLCRGRGALKLAAMLPRTHLVRGMARGPRLSPRPSCSVAVTASARSVSVRRR